MQSFGGSVGAFVVVVLFVVVVVLIVVVVVVVLFVVVVVGGVGRLVVVVAGGSVGSGVGTDENLYQHNEKNISMVKPGGQGQVSKSGASSGPLTQPSQL